MKLVIVGGRGGTNIGESFLRAAVAAGVDARLIDSAEAFRANRLVRALFWRLGRRPVHLRHFSQKVFAACSKFGDKTLLLTTGLAPVEESCMQSIRRDVVRVNYLTDDPWSPTHRSRWFLRSLPHYDIVFTPRLAIIDDLKKAGCRRIEYLPFGYDPDFFFPDSSVEEGGATALNSDIVFAGGADRDRVPYMAALSSAGFNLSLYGDYWDKFAETRGLTRGQADVAILRKVLSRSKVGLCLVRRQNRDGNCMRTFEVPAVGTCMLCEDTSEHREIFGEDGNAVVYFSSIEQMVERARWLLDHPVERERIARTGHELITRGGHTYADRLTTMLNAVSS